MSNKERSILIFISVSVALLTGSDLARDCLEGVSWGHLLIEACILFFSSIGFVLVLQRFLQGRHTTKDLTRNLAQTQVDLQKWKADAQNFIRGLGEAIDHQFTRWQLTPAEKEIASLLLKGLSFKEIAEARQASERTVRQQSLEIYRKSGLAGRAEFSAFFLEDLFQPQQSTPVSKI